jgi:hypothetical protein
VDRSNQAGWREDDQRKFETDGIVKGAPVDARSDYRRQEAPGDDEPDLSPGRRPETAEVDADGLSIDDRHDRAEFARWFQPSAFPATGWDLRDMAQDSSAPDGIRAMVDRLEPEARFETVSAAWEAARKAEA